MVIFLHGADTYRSRQRLHTLLAGFEKKYDRYRTNSARLDGTKMSVDQFRSAVNVTGFLSSKRLVVVENLLTKGAAEDVRSTVLDMLPRLDARDDVIVIFWEGDLEKAEERRRSKKRTAKKPEPAKASRKSLRTALESCTHAEHFDPLAGVHLMQWIRGETQRLGSSLQQAAADELVSRVGSDLWYMSTTLAKLASWKGKSGISAADVRSTVGLPHDENVFHLTDALAERNLSEALRLIEEQITSGAHELYILTMLVRQFRLLIQVRDTMDAEPNPATIAQRLKLHPFIVRRLVGQAEHYTLKELVGIHDRLLSMEEQLKTSSANPKVLFDLFAANLTIPGKLSQRVEASDEA